MNCLFLKLNWGNLTNDCFIATPGQAFILELYHFIGAGMRVAYSLERQGE